MSALPIAVPFLCLFAHRAVQPPRRRPCAEEPRTFCEVGMALSEAGNSKREDDFLRQRPSRLSEASLRINESLESSAVPHAVVSNA